MTRRLVWAVVLAYPVWVLVLAVDLAVSGWRPCIICG